MTVIFLSGEWIIGWSHHLSKLEGNNSPVSQYKRPRAVALASSACVDKTTKIITEFTRKDPFLHLKRANCVLQKVSLWSKSICLTCKLLMYVYLDIQSLYPHLKVNWKVLMCKICIARCLVVDIFPWCNANFVPFPSGTLVACRIGNGRIVSGFWLMWRELFTLSKGQNRKLMLAS